MTKKLLAGQKPRSQADASRPATGTSRGNVSIVSECRSSEIEMHATDSKNFESGTGNNCQ